MHLRLSLCLTEPAGEKLAHFGYGTVLPAVSHHDTAAYRMQFQSLFFEAYHMPILTIEEAPRFHAAVCLQRMASQADNRGAHFPPGGAHRGDLRPATQLASRTT
jgi:hypothetical protein